MLFHQATDLIIKGLPVHLKRILLYFVLRMRMRKGCHFILGGLLFFGIACSSEEASNSPEMAQLLEFVVKHKNPASMELVKRVTDSTYANIQQKRSLDPYEYYDIQSWYARCAQDNPKALKYADSMILSLKGLQGVQGMYAHALNTRGIVLKDQHLYNEALKQFYAAEIYTNTFLDSCASSEIFKNIGVMLYEQQNYPRAIDYVRKALAGARTCNESNHTTYFIQLQSCLNLIGLCYEKKEQLDSARIYYKQALEFLASRPKSYPNDAGFAELASGVVLGNLGNTEMLAGNFGLAEKYLSESVRINLKPDYDFPDAVLTQIKLGEVFVTQGEIERADSINFYLMRNVPRLTKPEGHARYLLFLKNLNDAKNEKLLAYKYFEAYRELRDSLNFAARQLARIDIEDALLHLSKLDELENLKTETEQRNFYLGLSLVLVFGLFVILMLIRRNLRDSRAHVQILNNLNKEVQEQNSKLMDAMDELEKSQADIQRMLGTVAHDLRSPIAGIVSLTDLLEFDDIPEETKKEQIIMIKRLANDSLEFMEDLLNMRSSVDEANKTQVDLLELAKYSERFMQLKADEKEQKIIVSGDHVQVMAVRDMIWRVLNNLLSNAVKFSYPKGTILINVFKEENEGVLSVKDNGIGIPDTLKKEVFEMLSKNKRMGTEGEKPFGLGLVICKQITEAHGGTINYESKEGHGTQFFMRFPLKKSKLREE
ncbi:MAG: tetratricopeptide repeat protein [Bacteroidetes bacterium]|nr:tetratricopeptide repeat protein [Bacteroidota bacterium]